MVDEGREIYANPVSIMRAAAMLLAHIGYASHADKYQKALDICTITEKRMEITGRSNGCTTSEFADYVMETIGKIK
jgi:isocitrate dehydrogenase (NAD+)